MRRLNSQRIETEKSKLITPVKITTSHVGFAVSLFSSIFLISGFAYNRIFFGQLGIDVSDFFSITDYLASSIDMLASTLISTSIGMMFFWWGVSSAVNNYLHEEQFETMNRKVDYAGYFLLTNVIICTIGIVTYAYKTGEISTLFLYPLVLILIMGIFYRIPLWKYVENRAPVGAVAISLMLFGLHLGFSIKHKLDDIKHGTYTNPYTLSLKDDYLKYSSYSFLARKFFLHLPFE